MDHRNKKYYPVIYLVICLFILIFIITNCEKEEVANPVKYGDFNSIIGSEAKSVTFFQNYSDIPGELFPTLDFPDQSFTEDTRITLDYKELFGTNLPDSLVTVTSECRYLWFFSAEDKVPLKPVQVTIPYSDSLGEKLLQPYEYLFKLYRIRKDASLSQPENFERVKNYELDTVENVFRFPVDSFNYGYAILFPEIKRDDHVIIYAKDDLFKVWDNNAIIQHLRSENYYSLENEFEKGFYHIANTSYFRIVDLWGQQSHFKFSFNGTTPGKYVLPEISLEYDTYALLISGAEYPEYVLNFKDYNTVITVEEYGNIGEYVQGTITGFLFEEYYHVPVEFNIYFRVKRLR
jgi:hypothetical protein